MIEWPDRWSATGSAADRTLTVSPPCWTAGEWTNHPGLAAPQVDAVGGESTRMRMSGRERACMITGNAAGKPAVRVSTETWFDENCDVLRTRWLASV